MRTCPSRTGYNLAKRKRQKLYFLIFSFIGFVVEQGVVIHFLPHIKKIKNKKIQEEKNDESLEDCL
jgi:hypothetical protein